MNNNLMMNNYIAIQERVKEALEDGRAVVALESTLLAHGLPFPENFELALKLEHIAQEGGVVPAVIAVMDGLIRVGLNQEQYKRLSTSKEFYKASLLDLPILLTKGLSGATTVASTIKIASLTGIKVFVTGGIGGVHRGGEETFDISADLLALKSCNVVVVSSGAKSILDLQKTKELLETLGIAVLGYQTKDFPAFYLKESGLPVDYQVDTPEEVTELVKVRETLGLQGGILVANPIPKEWELDRDQYQQILEKLLLELKEKGIKGKKITPYLLKRLMEETGGASLISNLALIENNMELGCLLAQAFVEMKP